MPLTAKPLHDGNPHSCAVPAASVSISRDVLVIGYGNELRTDDGLGPAVAREIERLNLPGVQVLITQQLVPELADPIGTAQAVIFIDAAVDDLAKIQVQQLHPRPTPGDLGHRSDPAGLLLLAHQLSGRHPLAWWLKIPAFDLSCGDSLSDRAAAQIEEALDTFHRLMPLWINRE